MYFPYLRGRQFEMIAIRELLEKDLISSKVIPIVEPVKLSSTLIKTMKLFIEKNNELVIVHNPIVGNFSNDLSEAKKADMVQRYYNLFNDNGITKGHIVNNDSERQLSILEKSGVPLENLVSISYKRDVLEQYKNIFSQLDCDYNLIPDDRKFGRVVKGNKVLLVNRYNKRDRNVDYLGVDEFYSDDHLYYRDEGYIGYSDFSIVGDSYSESGFAPYAVAIHLVYFNQDNELNVIHFVSDSNDDIRDPGAKFYEAIKKLYHWGKDKNINTYGYTELVKHYKGETYPGLGVVKKLCIMHHIELISQFLEEA